MVETWWTIPVAIGIAPISYMGMSKWGLHDWYGLDRRRTSQADDGVKHSDRRTAGRGSTGTVLNASSDRGHLLT